MITRPCIQAGDFESRNTPESHGLCDGRARHVGRAVHAAYHLSACIKVLNRLAKNVDNAGLRIDSDAAVRCDEAEARGIKEEGVGGRQKRNISVRRI